MSTRVKQCGAAIVLALLSVSALADTRWLASPAFLRENMRASLLVVVGRLTDVTVQQDAHARSGSGRIAVDYLITGVGRNLPAITWSDRNDRACPRLELDHFKGRPGVWFLRVDTSGAFDSNRSEFWELNEAMRVLVEIERSEPLSPDLQALRCALEFE